MNSAMKKFCVALLIETANEFGRGILRGITRYARHQGFWDIFLSTGIAESSSLSPNHKGLDGIIARQASLNAHAWETPDPIPVVLIDKEKEQCEPAHPFFRFPQIVTDHEAVAEMAADHLLHQGLRSFGFFGAQKAYWSTLRCQAFCKRIREAGFPISVFEYGNPYTNRSMNFVDLKRSRNLIRKWLQKLPAPAGIMACNDEWGRNLLAHCWNAGITVPDELTVLGVDNDYLLCEACIPPLTSIVMDTEQAGFNAAELLDRMMRKKRIIQGVLPVSPLRIIRRASTCVVRYDEPEVDRLIDFINRSVHLPLTVDDVVKNATSSRRTCEKKFKSVTGRTINEEILRCKIKKIKEYLLETDQNINQIAKNMAFSSASYLCRVFREQTGVTCGDFRQNRQKII